MFVKNAEKVFTKEDLFYCYDQKLKDFLCNDKGFSFIGKGNDKESKKDYWLFLRNNQLSSLLEWVDISKSCG